MKLPKIPKFSLPKIITTREATGQKEIIGLTPKEWVQSTAVLLVLYAVIVGYFTALLFIGQAIRNKGDYVSFFFLITISHPHLL